MKFETVVCSAAVEVVEAVQPQKKKWRGIEIHFPLSWEG